jgi:hypothetical protein
MPRHKRRYNTPAAAGPLREKLSMEERLARWKARYAAGLQVRKDWEQRYNVQALEESYLGPESYDETPDDSFFNHFFATIRVQVPGLFYQQPSFRCRPKPGQKGFGRRDAALMEALLQQIAAQDDNLTTDGKLALLQAFFRVGCLKTCYEPRLEHNPQGGQPLVSSVNGWAIPVLDADGQPVLEPDEILTDEVYAFEWVDARRLVLPDAGPNMRRWPWICEEIEVDLDEAKADTRFPRSLRQQFRANARAGEWSDTAAPPVAADATAADREMARFRYVEAWDVRGHQLVAWADGQAFSDTQFLLDEPTPDGVEGHPYSLLAFLPITGPKPCPWPLPVTFNWLPIQREYNVSRRQATHAGNRAARKFLYAQDTFPDSDEARKAMGSAVDMEGVEITDMNKPPVMIGDVPLSLDVARSTAALQYDWRVITGATGTRLSGEADSKTATEATFTERAANLRDSEMQSQVATWLGRAGAKMLQLVRQTLTLDTYVKVRGYSDRDFKELLQSPGFQQYVAAVFSPDIAQQLPALLALMPGLERGLRERLGQEQFLRVSRDTLQFEADVSVIPASLRLRNLESERASWLQLLTTLAQFPLILSSRVLLEETMAKFDFLSDDAIDELLLLGQRLMQMQAQQAAQPQAAKASGSAPTPNGQLPPMARRAA